MGVVNADNWLLKFSAALYQPYYIDELQNLRYVVGKPFRRASEPVMYLFNRRHEFQAKIQQLGTERTLFKSRPIVFDAIPASHLALSGQDCCKGYVRG